MMQIVGSVLYGADEYVAKFVADRLGDARFGTHSGGTIPYTALGVVRGNQMLGGIVFFNNYGHSIEASMAFDRADWARPSTLRRLFSYPYHQIGVARCTVLTARSNKRTRRFVEGIGFKVEGVVRKGADGHEDAILYGLLRREIAWLMEPKNGKQDASTFTAART